MVEYNRIMKRILYIITAALLLSSCDSRLDQHLRLVPTDDSIPVPSPVTVTEVRSTPGGAVIGIKYPDDDNIKGAIATYLRNGVEVNAKVSRYVDSLCVEGFPDTDPHEVKVSSFNVNEVLSEPVSVTVNPATPPIMSVRPSFFETYGGVKVLIEGNEAKADLAVCLLRCSDLADFNKPVKDIKWVEVTTMFTASNDIKLTRRNLEPVEAIYGAYIRDHWGNVTDTTIAKVTPLEENKLDHSKFVDANLADDNCKTANASYYPVKALWDDSGASEAGHFFACDEAPRPCWLTINLGQTACLSRVHTLPRIDYVIWQNSHPRIFEFWGWGEEANPTGDKDAANPHGFQTGWKLLGTFEQFKPSGYQEDGTVGDYTAEDREYFNSGNDFEFDSDLWEHANDPVRYLRVVFVDNFATYNSEATKMSVQIGEICPYGMVVEPEK